MNWAAFHNRHMRAIAIALVVVKLWFVTAQPMVVIAGAGHDDRLFVGRSEGVAIRRGDQKGSARFDPGT